MIIVNPFTGDKQFLAGYRKPGFKYQSSKSVVISASETAPAYFILGSETVKKTTNLECNLLINGTGGLDTGSLSASMVYYLYAVISDDDVKLMASLTDPDSGLSGFTWTYLGGFGTDASSNVLPFQSNMGRLVFGGYSGAAYETIITNGSPLTAHTFKCPVTAITVTAIGTWTTIGTAGHDAYYTSLSSGPEWIFASAPSTTANLNDRSGPIEFTLIESNTAYFRLTANTSELDLELSGWYEPVDAYQ